MKREWSANGCWRGCLLFAEREAATWRGVRDFHHFVLSEPLFFFRRRGASQLIAGDPEVSASNQLFKGDRLQMIVVAKKYICVATVHQ